VVPVDRVDHCMVVPTSNAYKYIWKCVYVSKEILWEKGGRCPIYVRDHDPSEGVIEVAECEVCRSCSVALRCSLRVTAKHR